MRVPEQQPDWPDSWRAVCHFDKIEVLRQTSRMSKGHALAYNVRLNKVLEMIAGAVPGSARILDLAAAQGTYSLALAEKGYNVVWNDLRAELEGYVRLKHESGAISYLPGNVFDLADEASFDAVVIAEIIEHVAHPDEFLSKVAKMVKPGGVIVMTTPNGAYCLNSLPKFSDCADPSQFEANQFKPDGDGHIFLIHPDEVYRLGEKAGLLVEQHLLFTNLLTAGHRKTSYILALLPWNLAMMQEKASQGLLGRLLPSAFANSATLFRKPLI